MEHFIYKLNGRKRPSFKRTKKWRIVLNKIPVIRDLTFIKLIVNNTYGFPRNTSIGKDFYCSAPNITVGQNVGLNDTFILAYAPVSIGNNCSFSFRNMLITSTHDINEFSTVIAKPIIIGDNVWITSNVIILPGVRIGNNSIIGAGSVVTNDIPSGVFAAGNPCKVVRNILFNK